MAIEDRHMKTQEVASALGLSVSTIKRWVDSGRLDASRTVGRHRLIRLSDALRFAREQGLSAASLEGLKFEGASELTSLDDHARKTLESLLRAGQAFQVKALFRSLVRAGFDAASLADELIRPVMKKIGHGWEMGELDVFQEHEATQILANVLNELVYKFTTREVKNGPYALGAAPEGDFYQLPLLLGELVLREQGWDVRNLGSNLPLRSLANAIELFHPRLVFLSVSHLHDEEFFLREYAIFYETVKKYGAAVIVGGRALRQKVRERLLFASYGDRMAHLAEFGRRLLPPPASAPPVEEI